MKRILPLAVVAVMFVLAAPAAFANHCERCRASTTVFQCIPSPVLPGQTECYADETGCWTSGIQCGPHTLASVPLATDYAVASVERLDEPVQPADEIRVAVLAPAPATRIP